MTVAPRTRLGPYEVLAKLGEGGMGEVYRARDTSLGRDVAIKVLPDAFAQDAERLARFEREARTLASLNHPNIAHVYGFEQGHGVRALVMELVEGPTLADRIAPGAMPLDEALGLEPRRYSSASVSPDGRRIAVSVVAALYDVDVWVGDVRPPTLRRATLHRGLIFPDPVWSADGSRLFYLSDSGDRGEYQLHSLSLDRGENVTIPLKSEGGRIEPSPPRSVSGDGVLIGEPRNVSPPCGEPTESRNSFWTLKAGAGGWRAGGEPLAFLEDRHRKQDPQFSPDGKWIAVISNQTGRDEVYLAPYPGPGSVVPVSTTGGTDPRWNPQGGELFFRNGDRMMAVAIETATGRVAGSPHELFEKPYPMLFDAYSVDAGGQRFLMVKAVPGDPPTAYHVIVNWHDELRRRAPFDR